VSLDVLPADVPAEYAPAMIAACSGALAEGSCVVAASLPESTQPEAVALVLWQGKGFLQVTVRVGRGGGQWVARGLTFSERDSISERWTTVGLTVATLVGETRALDAKAQPPVTSQVSSTAPSGSAATTVPDQHSRPPTERPKVAPEASRAWQGSIGLLTGPGWDAGSWQYGSWLSLGFRIPSTPVLLHAVGSYALGRGPNVQSRDLTTRFATLGLGAGVFGTLRALDLGGSASVEVAYRRADVDWSGRTASDQDVPVRLRALASFPASGSVAATVGAVVRLPPGNSNETSGLQVRSPAFSAEIVAGLEVRL
jgi:hypothetical protein